MTSLEKKLLLGGLILIVSAVALAATALLFGPFQYTQARTRWLQQRPPHYELDVAWASGWNYGSARIEVQDNQVIGAIDPATGQPLANPVKLSAAYFGLVDNLFVVIEQRVTPNWNWRNLLARFIPQFAATLDACGAPLGEVRYDPQYGYPTDLWYNDRWCSNSFYSYSHVTATRLTPLP